MSRLDELEYEVAMLAKLAARSNVRKFQRTFDMNGIMMTVIIKDYVESSNLERIDLTSYSRNTFE